MTQNYDVVIVGSSPVCLAEALYQASQKRTVCVLEKGKTGGSWKYIDAFGFKNLELGPHVLNGPYVGKKAMELFGLSLKKEKLHYFAVNEKRVYKKNMEFEKHLDKAFFWIKRMHKQPINIAKAGYNLIKICQIIFSRKKDRIFYFKGGTYELLKTFLLHPLWPKVKLKTNKCLNIGLSKSGATHPLSIKVDSGETIHAKKVFLTLGCDIEVEKVLSPFAKGDNKVFIQQKAFQSLQVLLLLKKNKKETPFTSFIYDDSSYIGNQNFLKNKEIKYCSDITKYVAHNNNSMSLGEKGFSIMALAVDPSSYLQENCEIDKEKLLKDLKRYDMLDQEAEIEGCHAENFYGKIMEYTYVEKHRDVLQNHGITILQSDNLLNSFAQNYKRWKPMKRALRSQ